MNALEVAQGNELPSILVALLKGVVYREQASQLWRDLLNLQGSARDHLRLLGLELIIDEAEGYAYLRQIEPDAATEDEDVPRLIPRRQLSYPLSLLLVLLRKRLAQHDAQGGETRLVLSREQIVDMMRTFLVVGTNEAKAEEQILRHIAKAEELGFLRTMKEGEDLYEVRRILRAFVNADWLAGLEAAYRDMRSGSTETAPLGFRLARLEVFNWGTFHARVWRIEPGGENALLTGDIGSGKSTLVDALTTLLVPPRKITYNKAAGAEVRERSLYSYVRGEYRSVSNELTGSAQAQSLRGENSYSVILGVFADRVAERNVTVAQVFWSKEGERNPERLYVVSNDRLTITEDFTGFGQDIQRLRKRLRGDPRVALFDSFEEYSVRLRRELGVPHAQALDLFYQTVSMKSVGNLTEFVRRHMLEPDDTDDRIRALIGNFENLNHAHDAVVRARDQIERLAPIAADGERLEAQESYVGALRRAREALAAYFAGHRAGLLERHIEQLEFDKGKWEQQLEGERTRLEELSRRRAELQAAIERQGGGRIREIDATIAQKEIERGRQRKMTRTTGASVARSRLNPASR